MPTRQACPSCGTNLNIPDGTPAGRSIRCPKCRTTFPAASPVEPPASPIQAEGPTPASPEAVTHRPVRRPDPEEVVAADDDFEEDEDFDDDEDESERRTRARRRRRDAGPGSGRREFHTRAELRRIAKYQRAIIGCILLNICAYALAMALRDQAPLIFLGIVLVVGVVSTVFVFLLSVELFGPVIGVLCGFLTLVPCVGLITLLVISSQATGTLRRHGYHVGFFGAAPSQFDR
jgi:hypothetical protein